MCCSPQKLSLRASVQFEVDQGVSRCHVVQAAAAVHRCCNGRYLLLTCSPHTITELCGGNLCLHYVSPLPPYSLLFLPALSVVSASVLQCLFCHPHTHKDTHTRLTQQFISIPNLCSERENEFRRSVVSLHGCVYQYLYIDLALPLLLHSSRYRLVFSAGICV